MDSVIQEIEHSLRVLKARGSQEELPLEQPVEPAPEAPAEEAAEKPLQPPEPSQLDPLEQSADQPQQPAQPQQAQPQTPPQHDATLALAKQIENLRQSERLQQEQFQRQAMAMASAESRRRAWLD